jgi:hypothetical protein
LQAEQLNIGGLVEQVGGLEKLVGEKMFKLLCDFDQFR